MPLSQKRAKDRATMAALLRELAELHGFTADIAPGYLDPREVRVQINAARGLKCSMSFKAAAEGRGGWGFLGHWHTDLDSPACLSLAFGFYCGGSVNDFHQRKATTYGGDDFEEFRSRLDRALTAVAAGQAWDEEREAWNRANPETSRQAGAGAAFRAYQRAKRQAA